MQTPVAFTFESYSFPFVELHMESLDDEASLRLEFNPHGTFFTADSKFQLDFEFTATPEGDEDPAVRIKCTATFKFREAVSLEQIPEYFYPNSLAIVFPYVRAFVSSVTLQANAGAPVVIPTLNLTGLRDSLKSNTRAE